MPEPQKRQVAYKVMIKDLIDGKYVKEEGWQPNYIITSHGRQIARANLIGTIVFKPAEENINYQDIVIDDGSGKISVRSFEGDILKNVNVGDVVLLIGRPREYGGEKYIVPEIIKVIENKKWIDVRKLEVDLHQKWNIVANNDVILNEEVVDEKIGDQAENIFKLIKEIDDGEGADTGEIVAKAKIENVEKIIGNLLEKGEIFEVKPGKLKILE